MRHYYYMEQSTGLCVAVKGSKRPSQATIPKSRGCWVVSEWDAPNQRFFAVGEVTWARLEKLKYIGSELVNAPSGLEERK